MKEKLNLLEETVTDDLEKLKLSKDEDAKVGHKRMTLLFGIQNSYSYDRRENYNGNNSYFRRKHDGKELTTLVEKSSKAGIDVKNIVGDADYSEKNNIDYAKENQVNGLR